MDILTAVEILPRRWSGFLSSREILRGGSCSVQSDATARFTLSQLGEPCAIGCKRTQLHACIHRPIALRRQTPESRRAATMAIDAIERTAKHIVLTVQDYSLFASRAVMNLVPPSALLDRSSSFNAISSAWVRRPSCCCPASSPAACWRCNPRPRSLSSAPRPSPAALFRSP
jgi:hypothetical protein